MIATTGGATTSKNTKNVRSELREMLRRGDKDIKTRGENGIPNKNNWVFSSAPQSAQSAAGAVDGTLRETLAVNHVTTTGEDKQIGVTITQDGKTLAKTSIDQTGSGYDVEREFMYFKAGVYNQNHTGDPVDYVKATFYKIEATHP